MLFQYQGLAEPVPVIPDASQFEYPPQVPTRRIVALAVGFCLVCPLPVIPDASQFEYAPQVAVRRDVRVQPDSSVGPILVSPDASQFEYGPQGPVRLLRREQPDSTVLPLPVFPDASQFEYPAQVPGRRTRSAAEGFTLTAPFPDLAPVAPFDPALLREYAPQFPRGWPGIAAWAPSSFGPVMVIANVEVHTQTRIARTLTTTPKQQFATRTARTITTRPQDP